MITQKITTPQIPNTAEQSGAEGMAIQALAHMAQDAELIGDFHSFSGIQPEEMRSAASAPGFLAGVLEFICARDDRLLAFTADSGLRPEAVDRARKILAGPAPDWTG